MDYSGDELFLLLLALIVACISIYRFWLPILRIRLLRPWPGRLVLAVVWIAGIAFLCYILTTAAARSVRERCQLHFSFPRRRHRLARHGPFRMPHVWNFLAS